MKVGARLILRWCKRTWWNHSAIAADFQELLQHARLRTMRPLTISRTWMIEPNLLISQFHTYVKICGKLNRKLMHHFSQTSVRDMIQFTLIYRPTVWSCLIYRSAPFFSCALTWWNSPRNNGSFLASSHRAMALETRPSKIVTLGVVWRLFLVSQTWFHGHCIEVRIDAYKLRLEIDPLA